MPSQADLERAYYLGAAGLTDAEAAGMSNADILALVHAAGASPGGSSGGSASSPSLTFPTRYPGARNVWAGQTPHGHTLTGVGAVFTDDTVDFVLGTRSIKIQTGGTHAQTYAEKNVTAFDATNKIPRIWLKLDNYTPGCDFRLWLGSDAAAWTNYLNYTITDGDTNKIYVPGSGWWVGITFPRSRAAIVGAPVITAIQRYRVQLYDNNTAMTFRFGGLQMVNDTNAQWPNGVLCVTLDDGLDDHILTVKPILDAVGARATVYPITEMFGTAGYMSLNEFKALADLGWDLGLHASTAANHNIAGGYKSLSRAQRRADIEAQLEFYATNGLLTNRHFAYPQGEFDATVWDDIKDLVSTARTTKARSTSPATGGESWPPGHRLAMYQRAFGSADTLANITAYLDSCKANKEILNLTTHQVVAAAPPASGTTTTIFQGVIDHAVSIGMPIRTVHDVMSYPDSILA